MKKEELTPWVSAELLNTNEAIENYLEACLEDGEPELINHAIGVVARAKENQKY